MANKKLRRICDVCNCPQFDSMSGWICSNNHIGASWHEGECKDYKVQRKRLFKVRKKVFDLK